VSTAKGVTDTILKRVGALGASGGVLALAGGGYLKIQEQREFRLPFIKDMVIIQFPQKQ
jgi:hypothetical protein